VCVCVGGGGCVEGGKFGMLSKANNSGLL
jgi:hypothetical protein